MVCASETETETVTVTPGVSVSVSPRAVPENLVGIMRYGSKTSGPARAGLDLIGLIHASGSYSF